MYDLELRITLLITLDLRLVSNIFSKNSLKKITDIEVDI